jgi:arsenate reductase-like glutaredoxin family protein
MSTNLECHESIHFTHYKAPLASANCKDPHLCFVWSLPDKEKIIKLHQRLGNNWEEIALSFPNKSLNQVKAYFENLLKKMHKLLADKTTPQAILCKMALTVSQCNHLLAYMIMGYQEAAYHKYDDACLAKLIKKKEMTVDDIIAFKDMLANKLPQSYEAFENCAGHSCFENNTSMIITNILVLPKLKTLIHYIREHERECVQLQIESRLPSIEEMLADSKQRYPDRTRKPHF